ncbi:hypothetical protein CTI14_67080, partial [Methylobacterium radiotolerans]
RRGKAIVAELSARGVTVEAKAVDITSRASVDRLIDRGAKHLVLAGARARPPTRQGDRRGAVGPGRDRRGQGRRHHQPRLGGPA